MKTIPKMLVKWSIAIIICCLFSSCYSVRLKNVYGDPEPDPVIGFIFLSISFGLLLKKGEEFLGIILNLSFPKCIII